MAVTSKEQYEIIRTDGIKLDDHICNIILDESDRNSFEYGEEKFKYPRFTNLYWAFGNLYSLGTHGEVILLTQRYWPITRYCKEKFEKEKEK